MHGARLPGVCGATCDIILDVHRLLTQKDLALARRGIKFCYICGNTFEPRERRVGDHVLPSAFSPQQVQGKKGSPAILDVHSACEQQKQGDDNWMTTVIRGPDDPRRPGKQNLKQLARHIRLLPASDGGHVAVIDDRGDRLRGAPWTWVRGCFALLYCEFLPVEVPNQILLPVPAGDLLDSTSAAEQLQRIEEQRALLLQVLEQSALRGTADGMLLWDGAGEFACVWYKATQAPVPNHLWRCIWGLRLPGVLKWSSSTRGDGVGVPWCGWFYKRNAPLGAALVPDGVFDDEGSGALPAGNSGTGTRVGQGPRAGTTPDLGSAPG